MKNLNLPTKITLTRIIFIPVFLLLMYVPGPEMTWLGTTDNSFQIAAAGLFVILALTDWLDGYLARKNNQVTALGKFLDPIADKALVFSAFLVLVEQNLIWSLPIILMLVREFVVATVRMMAAKEGLVMAADQLGKWKTVTQMIALILYLFHFTLFPIGMGLAVVCLWISVILSTISGIQYTKTGFEQLKE
ncbi:MAG: CDP-diacylglycerol--glycerol-3-phosphate 3-phosphatidyltransferase [Culicoidibacterales bacterium]